MIYEEFKGHRQHGCTSTDRMHEKRI